MGATSFILSQYDLKIDKNGFSFLQICVECLKDLM